MYAIFSKIVNSVHKTKLCLILMHIHNYLSISKSDIRKFGYKLTISKH